MNRFVLIFISILCTGHAIASDSVSANRGSKGVHNTKQFGDLSLSLTLSPPDTSAVSQQLPENARNVPQVESGDDARKLRELNAQIVAIEDMIRKQQSQLATSFSNRASPNATKQVESASVEERLAQVKIAGSEDSTVKPELMAENNEYKPIPAEVRKAPAQNLRQYDNMRDISKKWSAGMKWAVIFVGIFISALILLWFRKRRSVSRRKTGNSQLVESLKKINKQSTLKVVEHMPLVEPEINTSETAVLPKNQQPLLPPEYEMLEEADIYLRFGHDKLAEEALREAIKINPENPQSYLTLLRIYFSREDKAAFFEVAKKLKELGDKSIWARVTEMGLNLDGNNPLYH